MRVGKSVWVWVAVGAGLSCASAARADLATFYFAQVGSSYSAFLGDDDPLVGQQVVNARIYLDVRVTLGDAANFFTDISFPIDPLEGNVNALVLSGDDPELGWSGRGTFHYFLETTQFNGTFVSARYGAETPGQGYVGTILEGSRIEFDTVPEPSTVALCGLVALAVALRRR